MENLLENGKIGSDGAGDKPINTKVITTNEIKGEQNPNVPNATVKEEPATVPILQPSRTPFTDLSQEDADLALARTLQEQERVFMMLTVNNEGSYYGSDGDEESDDGTSDDDDEDDEIDPSDFPDDESYARALQQAEEREMASRFRALAGISNLNLRESADVQAHDDESQETGQREVDPDDFSYEELIALGDVVGTESKGLSSDKIASLPSIIIYKAQDNQNGNNVLCVICQLDYEDNETLTVLPCKHSYHSECVNNWLQINKVCPVCSAEVFSSQN